MKILHYSKEVMNNIETVYKVNGSDCKYTLNHPSNLIVDAEFVGKKSNYANSQGWERDSNKYFKELYEMHPEYFSDSNKVRIMNNKAPIVNEKFLKYFPEYADYRMQILVLHHIGGDGQMVAIPQDIHSKGFGEIHNVEKNLGIRDIAMSFSNQVEIQIDNGKFESGKRVTYYYDSLKERNLIDDDEHEAQSIISKTSNEVTKRDEIANKILDTILKPVAKYLKFREEHLIISSVLETTAGLCASVIVDGIINNDSKKSTNASNANSSKLNIKETTSVEQANDEVVEDLNIAPVATLKNMIMDSMKRKYTENDVPPGPQRYHTKEGIKLKQKPGYHRTGKNNNNDIKIDI